MRWISFVLLCAFARCVNAQSILISPRADVGPYSVKQWKADWPDCVYEDGVKEHHLSIVNRDGEKRFRVDYALREIGPEQGGAGWRFPIAKRSTATFNYVMRFGPEFDWVKGRKLPGLCGGPESVTGGNPADGRNGFSCRLMWRKDGRGEAYVYHMDQEGDYGDSFSFPDEFRFPTDTDIRVSMAVTMNAPTRSDGKLRVEVGFPPSSEMKLVIDRKDIQWRSTAEVAIDSILFETFHGGGNKTWAPSRECWTEFGSVSLTD